MSANINSKNFIRKNYYEESDLASGLKNLPQDLKTQKICFGNQDREFRVITAELDYNGLGRAKLGLWKFTRGLLAFFASIPLFTLFIPAVRNLWKEAVAGKEFRQIKLLTPEGVANRTAERVHDVVQSNQILNQEPGLNVSSGVNPV